jgi:hypothetical protein
MNLNVGIQKNIHELQTAIVLKLVSSTHTWRFIDPKERLKEEKDGIVLSPQRRSFGTGCHVTTPSMTRQVSCPADYKEDTRQLF